MTALPIYSRSCGECEECCRVVAVEELHKPYHTRCVHQTGKGCAIYGEHPAECKSYACVWLLGLLPEHMRPDKIGVLVDAEGANEWLVIQESQQGALDTPVGRELVQRVCGAVPGLRYGVRIDGYGAHRDGVDTPEGILGEYEEIAPKIFMYVGDDARDVRSLTDAGSPQEGGPQRNALCPCGSGRKYKKCCMTR